MHGLLRQDPVGRRRGRGDDVREVRDGYDQSVVAAKTSPELKSANLATTRTAPKRRRRRAQTRSESSRRRFRSFRALRVSQQVNAHPIVSQPTRKPVTRELEVYHADFFFDDKVAHTYFVVSRLHESKKTSRVRSPPRWGSRYSRRCS